MSLSLFPRCPVLPGWISLPSAVSGGGFFLSSSDSAIGISSAYNLPQIPENFCFTNSTLLLLSSIIWDLFLIPFVLLPENVADDTLLPRKNVEEHFSWHHLQQESLGTFISPGSFPYPPMDRKPRARMLGGRIFCHLPKHLWERNFTCFSVSSSLPATRGKWSQSQWMAHERGSGCNSRNSWSWARSGADGPQAPASPG